MPQRLRFKDLLESRFSKAVGLCSSDVFRCAQEANAAQERLVTCRETGEHGWWGSYAEMVFNVSRESPNLTTPLGVARVIDLTACRWPIALNNQFYEYMEFGSGNWPKASCALARCGCNPLAAFKRNMAVTFVDLTPGHTLRVYPSLAADVGLRALIGGTDANDQPITTLDGPALVQGAMVSFALPFADLILPDTTSPVPLNSLTAIQKDVTLGSVSFYDVDPDTGAQTLLLTMQPGETTAWYARYYLNALPRNCCNPPGGDSTTVQIKAMVKLDLVPVVVPTDYLLIQSKEALIAEGEAGRLADMDSADAKAQSAERHRAAIRFLQGELAHREGTDNVATDFAPFGNSPLSRVNITMQ